MDINSLLSPQDTPTGETPPPVAATSSPYPSPNKRPGRPTKRTSSTLSHQLVASPRTPQDQLLTPTVSHNGMQLPHIPLPSPGLLNALTAGGVNSAVSTPSTDGRTSQPPFPRQTSTQSMDTLADLASRQLHQQAPRDALSTPRSTPVSSLQNISRSISGSSLKDIAMLDGSPKAPKTFITKSLPAGDCLTLSQLSQSLLDKPFDYTWNIQFLSLLRKGFLEHINSGHPAYTYELLVDLHLARNALDSKYSLGEDMWAEWIRDEKTAVQSIDDRIKIMELCIRAITEEPSSAVLWRLYGDFMYDIWAASNGIEGAESWSEEDCQIGKEIWPFKSMMEVWEQAVNATQWRINDSNTVWDRWIELLQQDQTLWPSPAKIHNLEAIFSSRLMQPHATWDQTFQMYSSFVSTHRNAEYEKTMETASKQAAQAKASYAHREGFEFKILSASQNGDRDAEWYAFQSYLDWERVHQGVFSFNLINGLYERATIRFFNDPSLWEDYVEFLIQNQNADVSLLGVVERATRHCPWSGSLWSHRVLALEAEGQNFGTIENVKHKATETGMLETAGMEELLKVYIAWCGYLRRKAFQNPEATEDDIDIAEVGIRSALEHVREIGEKQLGKAYQGDPLYRLERIHIKFLMQSGNVAAARDLWKILIDKQGNSYDFWYRYYIWEMVVWSKFSMLDNNAGSHLRSPEEPTALLQKALKWIDTMDWPEQLVTMFLNHCEQHETVQELRKAIIEARKANTQITKRREKEQAEAAAVMEQQQAAAQRVPSDEASLELSSKRKREVENNNGGTTAKRSKTNVEAQPQDQQEDVVMVDSKDNASNSATNQAKRNRENATVIASNLSAETTQTSLRKFFSSCGTVVSISIQEENEVRMAVVEFESAEDAEYALTRQGQDLEGHTIEVSRGSQTTLFVANYAPEADESYIRNVFEKYGDVVSVRFPSLKYNTHRRFCYVQLLTPEQANAATQMDGQSVDGHKLVAKISNPSIKKDREGASYEGREVFVRNVHWKAQQEDIKSRFQQYGRIESVRIPKKLDGNSKGVAYVVFSTKEEADVAIEGMNEQQLMGRTLHVETSQPYGKVKRHQTTIVQSNSPEPGIGEQYRVNNGDGPRFKERTIALLNLPDTVNDARVRAITETHGPLVKIKLMHDHQGAIVEYQNAEDSRKAAFCLDAFEIAPGRRIRVGTVKDLLKDKEEIKHDKLTSRPAQKKGQNPKSGGVLQHASGFVSRPNQSSLSRRGGRGGLGFRKTHVGTGETSAGSASSPDNSTEDAPAAGGNKSQADFRAMLGGKN